MSSTVRSFSAAAQPIETWSSCIPEVGTESTEAGAASRRFSATIPAAVYWAIISPELTPGSGVRNAGSPRERVTSSSRSTRRSAIAPTSAAAMARKSAANAERRAVEIAGRLHPSVRQHHRVVHHRRQLPVGHLR